ncbi:recombinase RecT [Nonomuraea sp. PA05]|uniref:recombinase RecT n=1 Tax=Nonomuraea sp. PA05 TaxID=2604466 RepID=UPI0016525B6C|nr:recombinase RecT [Nonomuraea sp. PA05]
MGSDLTPQQKDRLAKLDDQIVEYERVFREALPPGIRIERFLQDAHNALANNPDLANVYAPSVIGGLVTCAQLNLRPHVPALGHAWLIPMRNKKAGGRLDATLIVGYKGLTDIGYRDRDTTMLGAYVVKEGDAFRTWFDDGVWRVQYEPNRRDAGRDQRPTEDYFAIAKYRGEVHVTEPMTHAQMVRHRNKYAMARTSGPWWDSGEHSPEFDEQGKKTMIRARLVKLLPQTIELVTAAYADEGTRTDDDPNADILQVTVHPGRDEDDASEEKGGQQPTHQPRSVVALITQRAITDGEQNGDDEPTKQELLANLGTALLNKGINGPAMLAYLSKVLKRQVSDPRELNRDDITKVQAAIGRSLFLDGETPDPPAPQAARPQVQPTEAAASQAASEPPAAPAAESTPGPASQKQRRPVGAANRATLTKLNTLFTEAGISDDARFLWLQGACNVEVTSTAQLTVAKADEAIRKLEPEVQARRKDLQVRIVTVWTDLDGTKDELTPALCLWVNANARRRKQPATSLDDVSNVHLAAFLTALSAAPDKGQITPDAYRQAIAAQTGTT